MTSGKTDGLKSKQRGNLQWVLIVVVVGVLALSILAFTSPVSQGDQVSTPLPTGTGGQEAGVLTETQQLTQTAEAEANPPTPEEIGYTDGIIFMSTLLILILLAATLREQLRRK